MTPDSVEPALFFLHSLAQSSNLHPHWLWNKSVSVFKRRCFWQHQMTPDSTPITVTVSLLLASLIAIQFTSSAYIQTKMMDHCLNFNSCFPHNLGLLLPHWFSSSTTFGYVWHGFVWARCNRSFFTHWMPLCYLDISFKTPRSEKLTLNAQSLQWSTT